jgi:hypothetical protein
MKNKNELNRQIELLKKYNISNYTTSEENTITINGSLYLISLTSCDKDFLKSTTINGSLYLISLTSCDKDFLKGTTINGYLDLRSLTSCDKDFLKSTTINGSLDLRSLTSCDKDFLKSTTINGYLDLRSLTSCDKAILNKNIKQLKIGYNKKLNYCFFDGILSKVKSIKEYKTYTIYTIAFGFVVKKRKYTAHGKTVKIAIQDLEFKIISEKLKKEPIKADTIITVQYYRIITGACQQGCDSWIKQNNIKKTEYKAKELLPLLEKYNAWGLEKFKSLINW